MLLDGVVTHTHDFGEVAGGPITLRGELEFSTSLAAGSHTLTSSGLFAPGRGVPPQYFDNVALDVVTPAVPELPTWATMILPRRGWRHGLSASQQRDGRSLRFTNLRF